MTSYEVRTPRVLVQVDDQQAVGDEKLAAMIRAIWECGFDTLTCGHDLGESNSDRPETLPHMTQWVESTHGWMLIDLPVDSGLAFLSAVAGSGPRDAFYVRMTLWAAPDAWEVNVKPMDMAMFQEARPSQFHLQLLQSAFAVMTCRR